MNRLAKKKKYYVRVRGYVTNNGKNFYDWSDQLTINPKTDEEWEDKDWEKMYSHEHFKRKIRCGSDSCRFSGT